MAAITVHFLGSTGQTLTLNVYPEASDVLAATAAFTEQANRKGLYIATVTTALTGLYYATIVNATSVHIRTEVVHLGDDAEIHRCGGWLYADLVSVDGDEDVVADIVAMPAALTLAVQYVDCLPVTLNNISAADVKTAMEAAGGHLALILADTGTTLPAAIAAIEAGEGSTVNITTETNVITVE